MKRNLTFSMFVFFTVFSFITCNQAKLSVNNNEDRDTVTTILTNYVFKDGSESPKFMEDFDISSSKSIDSIVDEDFAINQELKEVNIAPVDLIQIPCDSAIARIFLFIKILNKYFSINGYEYQINGANFFKPNSQLPVSVNCSSEIYGSYLDFRYTIYKLENSGEKILDTKAFFNNSDENLIGYRIENPSLSISFELEGEIPIEFRELFVDSQNVMSN